MSNESSSFLQNGDYTLNIDDGMIFEYRSSLPDELDKLFTSAPISTKYVICVVHEATKFLFLYSFALTSAAV